MVFKLISFQPILVYSSTDLYDDNLSPVNNQDALEIPLSDTKTQNYKRDAGTIINVIRDLLDTFYVSSKSNQKRAQFEDNR